MKTIDIKFCLPMPNPLWAPIYLAAAKNWYGLLPANFSINLIFASKLNDNGNNNENLDAVVAETLLSTPGVYLGACDPFMIINREAKAIASLLARMTFWVVAKQDIKLSKRDASDASKDRPTVIFSYPKGMTGNIVAHLLAQRLDLSPDTVKPVERPQDVLKAVIDPSNTFGAVGVTADDPSDELIKYKYYLATDPELSHYLTTCIIAKTALWSDDTTRNHAHAISEAVVGAIQLAILELRTLEESAIKLAFKKAACYDTDLKIDDFKRVVHDAIEKDVYPFSIRVDTTVWANGIRLRGEVDSSAENESKSTADDLLRYIDLLPARNATNTYLLRAFSALPRPDVLFLSALEKEHCALVELAEKFAGKVYSIVDSSAFPVKWAILRDNNGKDRTFVFALSREMGETAAASTLARIIADLSRGRKPKCLAMSGICAGRPADTKLGDLIVADRLFKFDDGKIERGEKVGEEIYGDLRTYMMREPVRTAILSSISQWNAIGLLSEAERTEAISQWPNGNIYEKLMSTHLKLPESVVQFENSILFMFSTGEELLSWDKLNEQLNKRGESCKIPKGFNWSQSNFWTVKDGGLDLTPEGLKQRGMLSVRCQSNSKEMPWHTDRSGIKVHLAPIGTSARLQKDPFVWVQVSRYLRKSLGVEMEAAAVGWAASENDIPFLVAKAVVDHADLRKDDTFQQYACWLSAAYLFDFLLVHALPSGLLDPS